MDGSRLLLPDSADVRDAFGMVAWINGGASQTQGERPCALASVLNDVLNRIALDASLGKAKAWEVDLASRIWRTIKQAIY